MDPLTTLLAAAAATGPNTLQSQALTALRSAGPQESFFTRTGNPHPLQLQQLAQPTTPQLSPIITQPTMAPTALTQPLSMPMMPMASPLADPTPSALHIPTLQTIRRIGQSSTSYGANNAATSNYTATSDDANRPGGVHPGQFSHTHPKAAGRLGTAGDAGPASAAQQCAQYSTTRRADNGQGDLRRAWDRPHAARQHYLPPFGGRTRRTTPTFVGATRSTKKERQTRRLPSQDRSRSHTRPQHQRHRRSRSHRRDRRSRSHGARRAIGPDPQQIPTWQDASTAPTPDRRMDPPQHTGPRAGASQSSQPPMETRAPSASYMDLTQEAAAAPQQPPSRFRPSNYTVDLSNTTTGDGEASSDDAP